MHQDEDLNQDSHKLLGAYMFVYIYMYVCVRYCVCIGVGTGLNARKQGGYTVTAHVHSCTSVHVLFFPLLRPDGANMSPKRGLLHHCLLHFN